MERRRLTDRERYEQKIKKLQLLRSRGQDIATTDLSANEDATLEGVWRLVAQHRAAATDRPA